MRYPVNAYDVVNNWLQKWEPDCSFHGKSREDFLEWKRRFRRHYRKSLGPWPEKVLLNVKVTDRVELDDHIRERVIYDSSPGVSTNRMFS